MNNTNAYTAIKDCRNELKHIKRIIRKSGSTSPICSYLTKYALIRTCGTIEVCYKTIIADYYEKYSSALGSFITHHVRNATRNGTYDNICTVLNEFDEAKSKNFKLAINNLRDKEKVVSSMKSLNTARNNVAHGISSTLSFVNIRDYFNNAVKVIEKLDNEMKWRNSIIEKRKTNVTFAFLSHSKGTHWKRRK